MGGTLTCSCRFSCITFGRGWTPIQTWYAVKIGLTVGRSYFSGLFLQTGFCHTCSWSLNQARKDGVIHRACNNVFPAVYVKCVCIGRESLSLDMEIPDYPTWAAQPSKVKLSTFNLYAPHWIFLHFSAHNGSSVLIIAIRCSSYLQLCPTLLAWWLVLRDLYSPTEKEVKRWHYLVCYIYSWGTQKM